MEKPDLNPYASPTVPHGDAATLRTFRSLWAGRALANRTLVIALFSLVGAWAAVGAMLTSEVWGRWAWRAGLSALSNDIVYDMIDKLGVALVVVGAVACVVSFAYGRWIHRISVALLLVPYAPLLYNILDWLWNKLMLT